MLRELQHGISKFKVSDTRPSRYRMLEIVLNPKMLLIEGDGSLEVPDMKSDMVDSLVHRRSLPVLPIASHDWIARH